MASNTELQELLTESPKKILGEQRRLLYVGLTRARDLVFTVGSGKNMPWIQTCCPTAEKKDYSKIANGEFDIWGVGINSLCSEYQYTKDEVKCSLASSQPSRIRNAGFDLSETAASDVYGHKYHSPSSYKDEGAILSTSPEKLESLPPIYLNHSHILDNEFGDCVHKIYALGSCPDKAKRLSVAERILGAYGLDAGYANDLIARFDDLCAYLRKAYGDPERGVDHELPFVYQDDQGRVFNGSIDMVWKTKDSCVIVDYKTFSGTPETALKECADKHASQMKIYRDALAATGETVANVLILYPINGLIVKVN
jgi:ATP-dependent exoDNAse (exonuclease V) beta subunit